MQARLLIEWQATTDHLGFCVSVILTKAQSLHEIHGLDCRADLDLDVRLGACKWDYVAYPRLTEITIDQDLDALQLLDKPSFLIPGMGNQGISGRPWSVTPC